MLAHSGPGLSNTNCSSDVHWRTLEGAVLGTAGNSGAGYSHLRMQSNLTSYIENESKQSLVGMVEKEQLAVFPTAGVCSKAVFDRLQGFSGSYLVVCKPMAEDMDFKNLRRLVAVAEGSTLY